MNPLRLYRWILRLYPARFRDDFREELDLAFRLEYEEARGVAARSGFLLRVLWDILRSLPAQLAREFAQDLRFAARVHARTPVRSSFAVLVLALALGVCSGVFSVVNALLLRPLPFEDPARLAQLHLYPRGAGEDPRAFHDWRKSSGYLKDAASFSVTTVNAGTRSQRMRAVTAEVSANFFTMLGTPMRHGRGFSEGEDAPGSNQVAVVGYGFWQQDLGGDPGAIGSRIQLSGVPFTVIGVAPPGFDYPSRASIWTPTVFDWERIPKAGVTFWQRIGRLAGGISFEAAESLYQSEIGELAPGGAPDEINRPRLIPLQEHLAGRVKRASTALLIGAGLVLLIAAASTAGMLVTRVFERQKEMEVRSALGASEARVTQQLVTESVVLALLAAGIGLAIGHWVCRVAALSNPASLELQQFSVLDWHVAGLAVLIALALTFLFGTLPARLLARATASGHVGGIRRLRTGLLQRGLVCAQIAASVSLLAGSFLVGTAFLELTRSDLGFDREGLVTLSVSLTGTRRESQSDRELYYREALERLKSVPGVVAAAGAEYLPLAASAFGGNRFHMGDPSKAEIAIVLPITEGYFRTLGTPVLYGREFLTGDGSAGDRVAVVNDAFARQFGDPSRMVGLRIATAGRGDGMRIIGVVKGQKLGILDRSITPQVYVPVTQRTPGLLNFVARVQGNANQLGLRCRDALQAIDPDVPVFDVHSMEERAGNGLNEPRFYALSVGFFGVFAFFLAVMGTYGMAASVVARRKREMGVRMALGSTPAGLRALIVSRSMLPIMLGLGLGVVAATMLGRVLLHLIEQSRPLEWPAVCAIATAMGACSLVSLWLATRTVSSGEPLAALRSE